MPRNENRMDRPPMPLTTNDDLSTETGGGHSQRRAAAEVSSTPGRGNDPSGYDVVTSAASPRPIATPTRWDRFVLFNIVIPILLVSVGAFILWMLGEAEASPLPPPDKSREAYLEALKETRVERIRSLEETERQLELVIDGTVVPYQEAQVSSEVAGRVTNKSPNCETGAIVTAGDLLMQIDETDYQLEVERLEKQLESEDRTLAEVDQEMKNAEASKQLAEKEFDLQKKEVTRVSKLRDLKNFASQAEVDRAQSAALQAEQQLLSLQNQLKLLASRKTRLETTKKLVDKQLEVAKLNRSRCKIIAPISGVIVSEQADVNTFVNRGTPLVTIEDTSKVEVTASMRMDQLHWVLDQDVANDFSLDPSYSGPRAGYDLPDTEAIIEYEVAGLRDTIHRWKGTLVSYAGIGIDPKTRTVPVRLLVENPTHYVDEMGKEIETDRTNALVRGMFVRVRLLLKPKPGLVVIPANALRPGNKVWKFQRDDTVIDEMIARDEAENEGNEIQLVARGATPAAESVTDSPKKVFDASNWAAGRVKFSKSVYPIESLRLGSTKATDRSAGKAPETSGRYWVCEAAPSGGNDSIAKWDLSAGDYVVVSPLDSVPEEGLPARAKTKP